MIEPLAKGTYQAVAKEYSSNIFNGRWSFKLIVDIDNGADANPYRIWHFVNAKWLPSVLIAKMIGIIVGERFLSSLTIDIVKQWTISKHMFGARISNNKRFMAGVDVVDWNGKRFNKIIDVTPKDVWMEPQIDSAKPQEEDDVPF